MSATAANLETPIAALDRKAFLALAVGSAGVVYGDIGTSPLYAFRESISHLAGARGVPAAADIVGIVSLMLWVLMVVVTLKYVLILMRFDNRGEGGTLSLMALVQRAGGKGAGLVVLIGMLGAGLFLGDAMLTPAISVLSAVEGLRVVGGLSDRIDPFVVPIALGVIVALFAVQSRGTGGVGRWFGPVCIVWFAVLAILGLNAILKAPEILVAFDPLRGFAVLQRHPALAAVILGSVFLTVTGAEALYADMGHFGRKPINFVWLALVFPCLILNYLGQGALTLLNPAAAKNPFFLLAPEWFQLPLVLLATAATVIASQAVISGAFSLTQQAIQLGLLPRLTLKPTSEEHSGQIYAPQVNWILLLGVTALVLAFGSSSALAGAYGISVVGAMITSSILAILAIHRLRGRSILASVVVFSPFVLVEAGFLIANLMKVAHGGYVPLLLAAAMIFVMRTWRQGRKRLAQVEQNDLDVADIVAMLKDRPPMRAKGAAVFLTAEQGKIPGSLLHNLKHNQVLHERVVLLTVQTLRRPRAPAGDRVSIEELAPGFTGLTLTYGFMETPNVTQGLSLARAKGLKFDIMRTSFFVSRRSVILRHRAGLGRLQDRLFAYLLRNSERAADYFGIPPSRVVELGAQVSI
jgi:KUP system potassium uptake protein